MMHLQAIGAAVGLVLAALVLALLLMVAGG